MNVEKTLFGKLLRKPCIWGFGSFCIFIQGIHCFHVYLLVNNILAWIDVINLRDIYE